jgi:hypothetical protein
MSLFLERYKQRREIVSVITISQSPISTFIGLRILPPRLGVIHPGQISPCLLAIIESHMAGAPPDQNANYFNQ